MTTWAIEHLVGTAAELHGRVIDVPPVRTATFLEPLSPAVVLGRSQAEPIAPAGGIDVVRRRSGGGAVWVAPQAQVWVDVVLPRGDRLWHDDVNRAAWWVGDVWAAALAACGVRRSEIEVHRGARACGPWGRAVCFAGVAAGEVTVGGRKAVGVAQRRTREYALFQCSVHVAWDPAPLVDALGLGAQAGVDLDGDVWTLGESGVDAVSVGAQFARSLPAT